MTHKESSRRDFLKKLAIGGGGVVLLGKYNFLFGNQPKNGILKAIIVDFDKCTGCRTCETACSAFHHQIEIEGEMLNGLGNPKLANIQVYHYNPDVDIPSICANCPDTPCVNACPVTPDPITGHKAIFRDELTQSIRTNHSVCISCGSCSRACESERTGVIKMNSISNHPEHICDHCGGNPQCVMNCPYDALSFREVDVDGTYFGLSPEEIAEKLFERYYAGEEVVNG
ncbi:MAG: 4Fe-4S dicluster domain-containing protein [Bacteroidales bacterium]|nr:4Fe-4S dicluster domain-containing protein [Bacteroidales bacterium]